MDLTSIVGLIGAATVVVLTLVIEGGSPAELVAHPQAIMITFVGSLVAAVFSSPIDVVMQIPKVVIITFTQHVKLDFLGMIDLISTMADKARREGLLALEEETKSITDDFMQKGIMMVVDGVDPNQIRAIMEVSIEQMAERHKQCYGFFNAAGGFSPTFGIIGTVMGLMGVLSDLSDPNTMAKKIAGAFLATLWGLLSANLIFLPIGAKLRAKSLHEVAYRAMLMEGILSIQAGENPRVIRDKLSAYVPPKEVAHLDSTRESGGDL